MIARRYKPVTEIVCFADGREIHPPDLYKANTMRMARRQRNLCAICQREFNTYRVPTFDHQDGRGMGAAIRDDRIVKTIEGFLEWFNAALCMRCQGVKGSRRYEWVGGCYRPVVR